ncbi:hypothetical protein Asfd1_58 [Aeromonas phage Asfd_1]|nr:hypothetical protein Asfd1_58 [Aeromonas phage Asfd_1]
MKKLPMRVADKVFESLRYIQPFDIDMIEMHICDKLKNNKNKLDEVFEKRDKRYKNTIQYALSDGEDGESEQEIIDRTTHSLNAEMGVAYILGGINGIFAWLDNIDISFDVPTDNFNIEIKASFAHWPTMHTAGAAPFGRSTGLSLYSGLVGKTDVYLIFNITEYNGRFYYNPNYFFTKRALQTYPHMIATAKRGGGAYIQPEHNMYTYFYRNWCQQRKIN